jgi:hypothetical protein
MNIDIVNLAVTQAGKRAAPSSPTGDIQPKLLIPPEDSSKIQATESAIIASSRQAAAELSVVRPEMVKKGSAFLADPNYPPLDKVNAIATMFIHDFFLNIDPQDSL